MRWTHCVGLVLAFSAGLTGCSDSTGLDFAPILVSDTVLLAVAPNSELPTALDVTADGLGGIHGGRFPGRPADALQWALVVRNREGPITLLPARALGISSGAAITPAITGQTFEGLREAPGASTFVLTEPVVMQVGSVYVIRSREISGTLGLTCIQYAKVQPLEVDRAAGTLRLRIVTNEQCGDPRLVFE